MKKLAMTLVIFTALFMAVYRFLPLQTQLLVDAQWHKLKAFASAKAEPKGNSLVAYDSNSSREAVMSVNRYQVAPKSELPIVATAYIQHLQNVLIEDEGTVINVLPDDNQGDRHQRIVVRASEGISVLIAHNIDLAPRIKKLTQGDKIRFRGEYVWNEKGGVVHWTHRDPRGNHEAGWLKFDGKTYQ